MLTNDKERQICAKYKAKSEADTMPHCYECPLNYLKHGSDMPEYTCKAIMHYDRHKRRWVLDDKENISIIQGGI